jgi:hypothetical protein
MRRRVGWAAGCFAVAGILNACVATPGAPSPPAGQPPTPSPAARTPRETPPSSPAATVAAEDALRQSYTGHGIHVHYPAEWLHGIESSGARSFVSPNTWPWFEIQDFGSLPDGGFRAFVDSVATSLKLDLDAEDVSESPTHVGDDDKAVLLRCHNIGAEGRAYYRVKLLTTQAGTVHELTMYSLAGQEPETEALLEQVMASLEFGDPAAASAVPTPVEVPREWKRFTSVVGPYSIGHPPDWIVRTSSEGTQDDIFAPDDRHVAIWCTTGSEGLDIDSSQLVNNMLLFAPTGVVTSSEPAIVDGLDARLSEIEDADGRGLFAIVDRDSMMCVIGLRSTTANAEADRRLMATFMSSFAFE